MARLGIMMQSASWMLGRLAVVAAFLVMWEVSVQLNWIDRFFFSSPTEIYRILQEWWRVGIILPNLGLTLSEAALGYLLGVTLGTMLGFVFAFMPRIATVFDPIMVVLNSFPRLTLAPLFIVWFGFGMTPKVVLVAAFIIFICFFNTYRGLREVDTELLDRARLWGASRWALTRHIYLPAAISWIITGLRASVGFALIGAVVGEYIGGDSGIGFLIMQGQHRLRMREVLAGLALLLVIAFFIDLALRRIEARSLRWQPAAARR
ncbi:MAG: ABC transporter permease subunit [Rhizobiales bacterium]|nr:ABC transporter permease subunit [Hyphomicrobiales bacterium]